MQGTVRAAERIRARSWRSGRLALAMIGLIIRAATLHAQAVSPILHLTFDEGGGGVAHDSSGTGNDAQLQGDAGWGQGIIGEALSLPGTSGSDAEISTPVVDTTHSFTAAAWVRLNNLAGYQTFVSEDSGFQSAFFLQKRGDTNTFTFVLPYAGTNGPGRAIIADSGTRPILHRWYHIAGVYDAPAHTASIYVDGALADSNFAVFASPADGRTGIGRGQYAYADVDWVNGDIADVRIYPDALTLAPGAIGQTMAWDCWNSWNGARTWTCSPCSPYGRDTR